MAKKCCDIIKKEDGGQGEPRFPLSLDQFYNVKKHTKDVFFIDWSQEPFTAVWLSEKPKQLTFESTVKWKDVNYQVNVCCKGDIAHIQRQYSDTDEMGIQANNSPLFKSLLQKCIRRQLTPLSLKVAKHLINIDIDSFLRRLFVIMLEDVCLHPCATALIWLTSAVTKGYHITNNQVSWLMGLTSHLCQENTKFYWWTERSTNMNMSSFIKKINESTIDSPYKDILYSMCFRMSYGGMKPDIDMFWYYIDRWFSLFTTGQTLHYQVFNSIPLDLIKSLTRDELLSIYYGADFHCFPQILSYLSKKFPRLTRDDIKFCIWENSSKTNSRCENDVDPQVLDMWRLIESDVVGMQKYLILNNHDH